MKKLKINKKVVANLTQVRGGIDKQKGWPTLGPICAIIIDMTKSNLFLFERGGVCCTELCASKNGTCPSQNPPCTTFSAQKCG